MTTWNPYASTADGPPPPWRWILAGTFGAVSGGLAVAWLLWGGPRLYTASLCFLGKAAAVVLLWLVAYGGGFGFITMADTLVRAIRRRLAPPSPWEPVESIPLVDVFNWPHPGCGYWALVPILGITGLLSLPWFYLGLHGVPLGRALLSALIGVPLGLYIAHREAKAGRL